MVSMTSPRMSPTMPHEPAVPAILPAIHDPSITGSRVVEPLCSVPPSKPVPTPTNILPPIHPYHGGEQRDGETFQDWMEHFEAVAQLAQWDDHYKLVYLVTSLRGTAKSFYRSCTPAQRSEYRLLLAELKKRFTPIRLTAVQTQLFHDRRQGPKETVDEFAQELRKLYAKAYETVIQGRPETEELGQQVLASQFVAGLRPELQTKLVGLEGNVDQLVMRARFEEAKDRELSLAKSAITHRKVQPAVQPSPPRPTNGLNRTTRMMQKGNVQDSTSLKTNGTLRKCYNCGLKGHLARSCPYPKSSRGETTGRPVSVVSVQERNSGCQQRIEKLR